MRWLGAAASMSGLIGRGLKRRRTLAAQSCVLAVRRVRHRRPGRGERLRWRPPSSRVRCHLLGGASPEMGCRWDDRCASPGAAVRDGRWPPSHRLSGYASESRRTAQEGRSRERRRRSLLQGVTPKKLLPEGFARLAVGRHGHCPMRRKGRIGRSSAGASPCGGRR
jgi:hypothetical protein